MTQIKAITKAELRPADHWTIRADHEWAFIFIDEKKGTIAIVSSFGNWGFTWSYHGASSLTAFLHEIEYDYFFHKVDEHHRGRMFDAKKTVEQTKRVILDWRRQGGNATVAREAWNDLDDIINDTDPSNKDVFLTRMYDSGAIYQVLGGDMISADRRHPQCEGFWTKLWPVFLEATKPPVDKCDCEDNPNHPTARGCSAFGCRIK